MPLLSTALIRLARLVRTLLTSPGRTPLAGLPAQNNDVSGWPGRASWWP
jgi:hypothetical protein